LRHLFIYVDHFGRGADDLGFRKGLRQFGSDGPVLRQLEFFFDAMEDSQHLIDDEWLADVIECAVVNSMNSGFHGTVRRHDDDFVPSVIRLLLFNTDTQSHIQFGIHTVNTAPRPTPLSTQMSPPCRVATSLTKASPRPNPL